MRFLLTLTLILVFGLSTSAQCLIAEYFLDGDAVDATGNGFDGIVMGAIPTIGFNGEGGGAFQFNGSEEIELNNNQPIINTKSFTLFVWAKMTGNGGGPDGQQIIFSQRATGTGSGGSIVNLFAESNGDLTFTLRDNNQSSATRIKVPAATDGDWHSYAISTDPTFMNLYFDGNMVGKISHNQPGSYNVNIDHVTIGSHYYQGSLRSAFEGDIDWLRIFDCTLTNTEIKALHDEDEPFICGLQASYPLDNSAIDTSGNNFNGVISGATGGPNYAGAPNQALLFDGIDDEVTLNGNKPVITSRVFTIIAKAKINGPGSGTGANPIFSQRGNSTGGGSSIINLFADAGNGKTSLIVRDEVNSQSSRLEVTAPLDGEWHCYAATVASTNDMTLYIDGKEVATSVHNQGSFFDKNIASVTVGSHYFQNTQQSSFNGSIDDISIYNCSLPADTIADQCAMPTGINTTEMLNIHAYPVPTKGHINLIYPGHLENKRYRILNVNGQVVQSGALSPFIQIDPLAKGIYLLEVLMNEENKAYRVKVIKQ